MKLPDKIYDILKWVCALYLPIITFVGTVADAYGLNVTALLTVLGAIGVLAGSILKISDVNYKKGAADDK